MKTVIRFTNKREADQNNMFGLRLPSKILFRVQDQVTESIEIAGGSCGNTHIFQQLQRNQPLFDERTGTSAVGLPFNTLAHPTRLSGFYAREAWFYNKLDISASVKLKIQQGMINMRAASHLTHI
jgi:hypothetical protein